MDTPRLKGIPIGIDDFKKLRERNCLFVDKSLFIKEIIDDPSEVKLITRPRFGKTLNLSMLRYFFEKSNDDSSPLFNDLSLWKEGEYYTSELGHIRLSLSLSTIGTSFRKVIITGSKPKN